MSVTTRPSKLREGYILRWLRELSTQIFSKHLEKNDIPGVLKQVAAKCPDKEAIVCDDKRITFRQLEEQAEILASGLSTLGVSKESWVAVMLPNCPEFVLSFLAIAKLGAVLAPVDIYYQKPELEMLLQSGDIATLITSREFLHVVEPAIRSYKNFRNLILKDLNSDYPNLKSMKSIGNTGNALPRVRSRDNLLYLYTSGTTGMPKGVVLSHANVIARGRNYWRRFPITEEDKCYNLAPLFRGAALFSVVIAGICYGITMVIPSDFRPHQVWEQITSENVSFFHANPFHFAVLANMPREENRKLPNIKLCFSSGNRLSPSIANKFLDKFGIRIAERYGTVEAGGIFVDGRTRRGVRIRLIDGNGKRIREKCQMGEIVVKTPMMAKEYRGLPELSRKIFKDGWFHTGDLGIIDEYDKLRIIYRKKTVVLIDGKEVYPDEVAEVFRSHPKVKDAMVFGAHTEANSTTLKALVVPKRSCSQEAILEYCSIRLASYKIPRLIEFREELPRSWKAVITGKEQAYPVWGEF